MCNTPRHSSWRDVCAAGARLLSIISAALSRSKATQKCFVYCLKSKALPVCLGHSREQPSHTTVLFTNGETEVDLSRRDAAAAGRRRPQLCREPIASWQRSVRAHARDFVLEGVTQSMLSLVITQLLDALPHHAPGSPHAQGARPRVAARALDDSSGFQSGDKASGARIGKSVHE